MCSEKLKQLEIEVGQCTKCRLHQNRNKPVFGQGPVPAPVVLVGEGPGAEEDLTGLPFVGKAGQLLDKILQACNFNRHQHVYIGNIVKCRPPANRVPQPDEMRLCLPYLEQQIELLKPKIIITVGATALNGLTGENLKITKERGKWRLWGHYPLMPVYHPAALLRNPGLKPDTWEDFKNIIRKYRELADPDHPCQYV